MFHSIEGWFWKRNEDGSVHIEVREEPKDNSPIVRAIDLPDNIWASIVATVSKKGETGETWERARKQHNED